MLTHFRYTIAPSPIDEMLSIKNEVELDGMKRAYFRDGVSFVGEHLNKPFRVTDIGAGSIPCLVGGQTARRL